MDSNHWEVFLPAGLAEICWLDEDADDLYFTARAALDTVKVLPDTAAELHDLPAALDRVFAEVDWSQPG